MTDVNQARQSIVLLAIAVEGGLVALAWLTGWLLDHPPLAQLRWNLADALLGVAATLPLLLLAWVLMRWPFGPLAPIKRFTEQVICPVLYPCTRLDLLGISVLAGLGEELLFRGVFQPLLARWLGIGLGLALASALFGILHAVTLTYALFAFMLGAYLGWLALERDNLLAPVVAHALYDFVMLMYLLYGPGLPPELRQGEPDDLLS